MEKESQIKVGDHVRSSSHHWKRPNDPGEVVEINWARGDNSILVQFMKSYPGGGVDGNKIWMNPRELTLEDAAKRKPQT